ncbi:site-specific DNA-methyltransferase [Nocardioides alkalitolerans]|uniref:site-specific DNA-methyltransferase n=1 Tax=Nocardioides alkalitolerans TaxID=281714 RepID=UPI0009FFB2C7|nr:site-specific DNA-methyltransferase [Nocardioides alkalitolerans]
MSVDLDAIRERAPVSVARAARRRLTADRSQEGIGAPNTLDPKQSVHGAGRNPGDVWNLPTTPFPGAHFAVMTPALADRCIAAGCKPGGVVLDPFSGSGTTGMVATRRGLRYVGIDLSADYLDLSLRTRLGQPGLLDGLPS